MIRVAPPAAQLPDGLVELINATAVATAAEDVSAAAGILATSPLTDIAHQTALHTINSTAYRLNAAYHQWGQLEEYQLRATLYWCRVLYGLLSLPFVVFAMPLICFTASRSSSLTV